MSDTNTSNEVGKNNLYDNYNYANGKPVTTFFPVDLDTKNLDIVNPDGTSGVVIVEESSAASIDPDAIQHEPVVLLVGSVPKEKVAAVKKMISDKAKASGGIGLEEGGVPTYKEKGEKARKTGGREQGQ